MSYAAPTSSGLRCPARGSEVDSLFGEVSAVDTTCTRISTGKTEGSGPVESKPRVLEWAERVERVVVAMEQAEDHARGVAAPATTVVAPVAAEDPAASHGAAPCLETLHPDGPDHRPPSTPPASTSAARAGHGSAIVEGLRWTIISRPAAEVISLVSSAILARLVVPAEFGRYTVALVVLALANVPTQAVSYTLVQRDELDRDHLRTGLTLTVILGLAICALIFAGSHLIVDPVFGERTAALVVLMIPACFLNSINTVPIAVLSRRLQFRRLSLVDLTITLTAAIAATVMAAAGLNAAAMVLATSVGTIAGIILLCIWAPPPIPNFRVKAARDLLRLGVPAASGAASQACFWNCDYLIVTARLGALQAGYYFRAYTVSVMYQNKVTQLLHSIGFPVLSRASNADEVEALRQRMVHAVTLPLFPLLALLAIIAPRFVPWFYGSAWGPAVPIVQILTIGGAAMCVASALLAALLASGRPRGMMRWGWAHFAVYAGSVFVLARVGLDAVAIGAAVVHTGFLLICYVLLVHGSVTRAAKLLTKDLMPALASCIGLAALALPISAIVSQLHLPTFPSLVAIALAGAIGYMVALWLCFRQTIIDLLPLARRVLPGRTAALVARFAPRQIQSVA